MSHISLILTGLMSLFLIVYFAPGIFALNRGNILRNIALWLAIFLGLTLVYKSFGPDSAHPLFGRPDVISDMGQNNAAEEDPSSKEDAEDSAQKTPDGSNDAGKDEDQGDFTPPKE